MDLCKAEDRNQGAGVGMCWWEQARIDVVGAMDMAKAAAEAQEDSME